MYSTVPNGTSTFSTGTTGFAFLLFSNTHMAIYGISGTNASLLCGNVPSTASVSYDNGTLTITNPNTWNARLFVIC